MQLFRKSLLQVTGLLFALTLLTIMIQCDGQERGPEIFTDQLSHNDLGNYQNLSVTSNVRYNQVQQKSSHNSYSRDEGILDQLVYHRVRSIEFDIHRSKIGRSSLSGDWYIYHIPVVDTGTNVDRLSSALQELKVFHSQQPNHEVVTIWFDVKDGWDGSQSPEGFDNLVRQYISEENILKPSNLMDACPGAANLKASVTGSCAWPTFESLKGKFMFILTDGVYSSSRPDRLGFSSGTASSEGDVNNSNRIIFNQGEADNNLSTYIYNQGFVTRRYVLDDQDAFNSALSGKVHHLATNKINYHQDTWSKTHNGIGWPFTCIEGCDLQVEEETVIGIEVNSEDIWGRSDHFVFLHQDKGSANGRWITSINNANSHTDEWTKGCIMARASTASNSPYFAVCRAGDNKKLRIQYRDNYGNNSGAHDTDIAWADGLDQPNLTYVKMDVYNNGTCAAGFGSQDGIHWTRIGTRCFSHTLKYQGIGGSSHGNAAVKHLFTRLSYWGNVQRKEDFQTSAIGTVRYHKEFDGSFKTPGSKELYDPGTSSSPVFFGYTRVTPETSTMTSPYGWTDTSGIQSRDRGSGAGNDLNRDLVFHSEPRTFEQMVPNGPWYAMITFGDIYKHDNQAVDVEGVRALNDITTQPGEYRNEFVAAMVTDGRFSITFSDQGGTDINWTITRIVIQNTPFGGQPALP